MSNKLYEMSVMNQHKMSSTALDYLLIAANSDLRSYKCIQEMAQNGAQVKNLVIYDYDKFRPSTEQTQELQNYNKYFEFKPTKVVKCSSEDDDVFAINDISFLTNDQIGIDITGFSIPDLFRIIYVLKEIKNVNNLHVFYTEPKYYSFKNGLYDSYEYMIGEQDTKTIPEYFISGKSDKEALIIFLGFDRLVSKVVHETVMPSDVLIVNGFPSYTPKLKDISLLNNFELLSTIGKEKLYFTRANNPFSTYNLLCQIKQKFSDSLLNICVLGTKPMALGACVFAIENKDCVKVTYPYPKTYGHHTAKDSSKLWYYNISFDKGV